MYEIEFIKLGLFLTVIGFITLIVIVIIKIDGYIENKYHGGNRYKNCLHW